MIMISSRISALVIFVHLIAILILFPVHVDANIGMVGSSCTTSNDCFGVGCVCQQYRCVCANGYQQSGVSCLPYQQQQPQYNSMGGQNQFYGNQNQFYGGGVGYQHQQQPYPGQQCTYGCAGGAICQGGICCCPSGYSQTLTGCIPNVGSYGSGIGGQISILVGGQQQPYQYQQQYQQTLNPGQACSGGGGYTQSGNFGTTCGGGSYCNQGVCCCPPNCYVQNQQCVSNQQTQQQTGYGYGQTYGGNGYGQTYGGNGYGQTYGGNGYGQTYGGNGYGQTYGGNGYGVRGRIRAKDSPMRHESLDHASMMHNHEKAMNLNETETAFNQNQTEESNNNSTFLA